MMINAGLTAQLLGLAPIPNPKLWYVVYFPDEGNYCDVIPSTWFCNSEKTEAFWPPVTLRGFPLTKAIQTHRKPESNWFKCKVVLRYPTAFSKCIEFLFFI